MHGTLLWLSPCFCFKSWTCPRPYTMPGEESDACSGFHHANSTDLPGTNQANPAVLVLSSEPSIFARLFKKKSEWLRSPLPAEQNLRLFFNALHWFFFKIISTTIQQKWLFTFKGIYVSKHVNVYNFSSISQSFILQPTVMNFHKSCPNSESQLGGSGMAHNCKIQCRCKAVVFSKLRATIT